MNEKPLRGRALLLVWISLSACGGAAEPVASPAEKAAQNDELLHRLLDAQVHRGDETFATERWVQSTRSYNTALLSDENIKSEGMRLAPAVRTHAVENRALARKHWFEDVFAPAMKTDEAGTNAVAHFQKYKSLADEAVLIADGTALKLVVPKLEQYAGPAMEEAIALPDTKALEAYALGSSIVTSLTNAVAIANSAELGVAEKAIADGHAYSSPAAASAHAEGGVAKFSTSARDKIAPRLAVLAQARRDRVLAVAAHTNDPFVLYMNRWLAKHWGAPVDVGKVPTKIGIIEPAVQPPKGPEVPIAVAREAGPCEPLAQRTFSDLEAPEGTRFDIGACSYSEARSSRGIDVQYTERVTTITQGELHEVCRETGERETGMMRCSHGWEGGKQTQHCWPLTVPTTQCLWMHGDPTTKGEDVQRTEHVEADIKAIKMAAKGQLTVTLDGKLRTFPVESTCAEEQRAYKGAHAKSAFYDNACVSAIFYDLQKRAKRALDEGRGGPAPKPPSFEPSATELKAIQDALLRRDEAALVAILQDTYLLTHEEADEFIRTARAQ